jgi:hypothetical protein
MEREQ